jgi:hypothetical protein
VSAHEAWCRANGVSTSPVGSRRALVRAELEGLDRAVERGEKNARHAPTELDRERALARVDRLIARIVALNDEMFVPEGVPACDSCGEPFPDRTKAWEAGYECLRCRTERGQR